MKKEVFYTYLGTNGTITSPVHLEGIPSIKKVRLTADTFKVIVDEDGNEFAEITVPAADVAKYSEKLAK